MDEDLDALSREQLIAEATKLRHAIRMHRDASGHELCWHHPDLWSLLPEGAAPAIAVPAWPQFMRGCIRYRQSLDEQAPQAPRTNLEFIGDPAGPALSSETLKSLFGHKSWADSELFALLASLPPEHAGQLHACLRTLNHIHVVDRLFRAHLSAEPRPFDTTHTKETPSLAQLQHDAAATDAWYEQYVAGLPLAGLSEAIDFTFTDGDRGRMSREEILLHVVMHGGYHRGNVGQVLKSISVAPPRDLYTRFLHHSEPARREPRAEPPAAAMQRPVPAGFRPGQSS